MNDENETVLMGSPHCEENTTSTEAALKETHLLAEAPDLDIVIIAPRDDLILPERQTADSGLVPHERCRAFAVLAIPHLDRSIVTAADESQLIASDAPNALDMSEECLRHFAGLNVPQANGVVERTGDEKGLFPLWRWLVDIRGG